MPEISIIVPVYNVEKYIHRCVDSILNQTFVDFELILVDDGSPDNCGVICDEYALKDNRVCVIHKENGGVSSARNAGLDNAQGKYIMFCDSDDYVSNKWCEQLYRAATSNPRAFICCSIERIDEDGNCIPKSNGEQLNNSIESCISTSYFDIYKKGLSGYSVNKIFFSEVIRTNSLRFDNKRKIGEDAEFCAKYCEYCSSCLYIPSALYYYVQRSNSTMQNYYSNWLELHIPAFSWRLPLIQDSDIPSYCDIWVGQFVQMFKYIFDPRCELSIIRKLQYNNKMIKTCEIRYCFAHASGDNENPLVMKILRTHNYYLFWLFEQLLRFRGKLRRKK